MHSGTPPLIRAVVPRTADEAVACLRFFSARARVPTLLAELPNTRCASYLHDAVRAVAAASAANAPSGEGAVACTLAHTLRDVLSSSSPILLPLSLMSALGENLQPATLMAIARQIRQLVQAPPEVIAVLGAA